MSSTGVRYQVSGIRCQVITCQVPVSDIMFCVVPCLLCRGCIGWERSCVLPNCICPNSQWRFPVWEVLCGRVSENLFVWRQGRRAVCSNLETYPCVCVWSTFSNSLSYFLHWFILFIHIYMFCNHQNLGLMAFGPIITCQVPVSDIKCQVSDVK